MNNPHEMRINKCKTLNCCPLCLNNDYGKVFNVLGFICMRRATLDYILALCYGLRSAFVEFEVIGLLNKKASGTLCFI